MTPARPDLLRILVRSVVACVITELVAVGALVAVRDWQLPWQALAHAVGWGLGAGAALTVAEAALWRFGVGFALLAGMWLCPLAPLGAAFEFSFVQTWSSRDATAAVLARLEEPEPLAWVGFVLAATFVYGPLLVALHRRASPAGQALAMAVGTALWSVLAFVVGPWTWWLDAGDLPIMLLVPVLVMPPGRRLGDRVARLVRRRAAASRAPSERRAIRALQVVTLAALVALPAVVSLTGEVESLRQRWRATVFADREAMLALGDRAYGIGGPRGPELPLSLPTLVRLNENIDYSLIMNLDERNGEAVRWHRLAAAQGDVVAMRRFARVFETYWITRPTTDAEREAHGWLRQAVVAGDLAATIEVVRRLHPVSLRREVATNDAGWLAVARDTLRSAHAARAEVERRAPRDPIGVTSARSAVAHALFRALAEYPTLLPAVELARIDEALEVAAELARRGDPEFTDDLLRRRAALEAWRAVPR